MSVDPAPPFVPNWQSPSGTSTARRRIVLVAEDDDAVRELIRVALEQAGYAVVAAPDGRAAGNLFAADPGRYDLVLTDVMMPHATGPELVARVRRHRPNVPVLFMSACPGGLGLTPNVIPPGEVLLEKPFTVTNLLETVTELLDA